MSDSGQHAFVRRRIGDAGPGDRVDHARKRRLPVDTQPGLDRHDFGDESFAGTGGELQALARESLESGFQACPPAGIAQPLVRHQVLELIEVADVDLEFHVNAIIEHVDFGDVGRCFCAGQVDPICACGRHGETCYQ
jgi:hypothetical protein